MALLEVEDRVLGADTVFPEVWIRVDELLLLEAERIDDLAHPMGGLGLDYPRGDLMVHRCFFRRRERPLGGEAVLLRQVN